MANKKYDQFTEKTQESEVSKLVGLSSDGTENIQIDPTKIADFTTFSDETSAAAVGNLVGLNAAGTQRIKITPNNLIDFSGYSTETNQSNVSFLTGLNAAGTDKVKIDPSKIGKSVFTGGVWEGYTYQLVTSPTTGKVWLDRNIGATQVATSASDSNSFGFLFQFGRSADNHQFRNSSTTTTQEVSETNTSSNFVLNSNNWSANLSYYIWKPDWESKIMNDVCPPGFRLPTQSELLAEVAGFTSSNLSGAFSSFLKISASEIRDNNSGSISNYNQAYLWLDNQSYLYFGSSGAYVTSGPLSAAVGVRCIKI